MYISCDIAGYIISMVGLVSICDGALHKRDKAKANKCKCGGTRTWSRDKSPELSQFSLIVP